MAMEKAQKRRLGIFLSRRQLKLQEYTFKVSLQSHRTKTQEKNLRADRDEAEWEPD
jgi:hypothetical protein